jgi:hypothetical protein
MTTRGKNHLLGMILLTLALCWGCAEAGVDPQDTTATNNGDATNNGGGTTNNGGGVNCPNACTEGEQLCIGPSEVFRCEPQSNGCTAFTLIDTCDLGSSCVGGQCQGAGSCVDNDGDGRGRDCDLGTDCDDGDADRYQGATEVCDQKDNNCDGQTDEGEVCQSDCAGQACTPGERECVGDSVRECERDAEGCGVWGAEVSCGGACAGGNCEGCEDPDGDQRGPGCALGEDCDQRDPSTYNGAAELCDGVDNDCDGSTDEDFADLGQSCESGLGACARQGSVECTPSGFATRCSAESGQAQEEVCGDSIDNDCDGRTDEGFEEIGSPCSAGMGACSGQGMLDCVGGQVQCTAQSGSPQTEVCDGDDNDCDGQTDEDDVCGGGGGDFSCVSGNDTSPDATGLASGGSALAAICDASQQDWYDLGVLAVGQSITLDLSANNFSNSGEPLRFQLFGGSSVSFIRSSISDHPRTHLSYTATSNTRHYIQVLYSGAFPGGNLEYTLERSQ